MKGKKREIFWGLHCSNTSFKLEWKNVKCSALQRSNGKLKILSLPIADRLSHCQRCPQPKQSPAKPLNYLHITLGCININVLCLDGQEWAQTFHDSYHITLRYGYGSLQGSAGNDGKLVLEPGQHPQGRSINWSTPRGQWVCHVSIHLNSASFIDDIIVLPSKVNVDAMIYLQHSLSFVLILPWGWRRREQSNPSREIGSIVVCQR